MNASLAQRRVPEGFLRARLLAMYLLSLHAAANALLAGGLPRAEALRALATCAGALALALVIGEAMRPWLEAWISGVRRTSLVMSSSLLYAGALVFMFLALAGRGSTEALGPLALTLAVVQAALLLLAGVGRGYRGALYNALVMTMLASLAGGAVAAVAVTGFFGLFSIYLAFDHAARKLAAYPSGGPASPGSTFVRAMGFAVPIMAVMGAIFSLRPATAYGPLAREAMPPISEEMIYAAYRDLLVLAGLGAGVVWVIVKVLGRERGGAAAPTLEAVAAEFVREESLPSAPTRREVEYPGPRGRVVRAYLSFLEQAARLGSRRRPDQTPREYFERMGPVRELDVLTALFMRARYGAEEMDESEARSAERAAQAASASLRSGG